MTANADGDEIRVLLVGPFAGPRWVSITRYVEALSAGLERVGTPFGQAQAPWWNPPSMIEGVQRRWWRQASLRDLTKRDVVHLTDHALGHHVERFGPGRTVVTCHDLMPFILAGFYRSRAEGVVKRGLLRKSLRGMLGAARLIAVSETTANDIVRLFGYPRERISLVPNIVGDGFVPNEAAETELRASGVALPAGPRVLSVGHAGEYKNLECLIAAMARPVLRGSSLVRVGEPLRAHQRALAQRLGVGGRIVELGRVSNATLARVYGACDVLAQPSRYEGFGVPVIEAMACGLPVVCGNGGALGEVAGGAAVVVPLTQDPRSDAGALAEALASVLGSEGERERLRTAGLVRAEAFRPEQVIPKLLAVYRAVLSAAPAR